MHSESLRTDLLALTDTVSRHLDAAFRSLNGKDRDLAADVVTIRYAINRDLDRFVERCQHQLHDDNDARFALAAIKIAGELRDVSYQTGRIARMVMTRSRDNRELWFAPLLCEVQDHLHEAVRSFVAGDLAMSARRARTSWGPAYTQFLQDLTTRMTQEPREISRLLRMARVLRALEHVAVHIQNIGKYATRLYANPPPAVRETEPQ